MIVAHRGDYLTHRMDQIYCPLEWNTAIEYAELVAWDVLMWMVKSVEERGGDTGCVKIKALCICCMESKKMNLRAPS